MPTKEEVYDEQISPLMMQIIAICNEHKIANVCSFSLDDEGDLVCTTAMLTDEFSPPQSLEDAIKCIYDDRTQPIMMTIDNGDGGKEIHAIL